MTSATLRPDLAAVLDDAGVGDDIRQYLIKRGITTTGVMAAMASTVAELDSTVVQPLESGFVLDASTTLKLDTLRLPVERA